MRGKFIWWLMKLKNCLAHLKYIILDLFPCTGLGRLVLTWNTTTTYCISSLSTVTLNLTPSSITSFFFFFKLLHELGNVICPDWGDTRQPGEPSDQLSMHPASNQAWPRTRGGSGSRPCSGNSTLGTDNSLEKKRTENTEIKLFWRDKSILPQSTNTEWNWPR